MLSHFSCRVFKLGLWERVWYNSMTEVIPLSIWALNGPLKYSLVRKNFSNWCFLIFIIIIIIPFPTDYSLDLKMQFNHFWLPLRSGLSPVLIKYNPFRILEVKWEQQTCLLQILIHAPQKAVFCLGGPLFKHIGLNNKKFTGSREGKTMLNAILSNSQ